MRTTLVTAVVSLLVAGAAVGSARAESVDIRIIGSGYTVLPLVRAWIAAYLPAHPDVSIEALGEGAAMGPAALISGRAQIAALSRPMSPGEVEVFRKRKGYDPVGIPVALDAIAIYVNASNPLEKLTLSQVDAIFSETRRCGAPKPLNRWGELGLGGEWAGAAIRLYGRGPESGTGSYFERAALCGGLMRASVIDTAGGDALALVIADQKRAIGFGGQPAAHPEARVVPLGAGPRGPWVLPDPEALRSGAYPLTRQLELYVARDPARPLEPEVAGFLHFALSAEGQAIVEQQGFLRAPDAGVRESLSRIE